MLGLFFRKFRWDLCVVFSSNDSLLGGDSSCVFYILVFALVVLSRLFSFYFLA